MKKVFALILALALVLSAVCALAGESKPSKQDASSSYAVMDSGDNTDYSKYSTPKTEAEPPAEEITSKFLDPNEATKEISEGIKEKGLDFFDDATKAQIPDGYTVINEIVTYLLDKVPAGTTSLTLNYVFDTPYKAGDVVIVAFGIPNEDGTTEWILTEGVVQDDVSAQQEGSVNVTLTQEIIEKISGKEVTIVVISKPVE